MKYFLLGATGMLGSAFIRTFASNSNANVVAPIRGSVPLEYQNLPRNLQVLPEFIFTEQSILSKLDQVRPDFVINCLGFIKQREHATGAYGEMLWLNGYLPQVIAHWCAREKSKLITFSTDCVFSGLEGNYTENMIPSPVDFYGVSKLAGEISDGNSLTLRTSIIGPEIRNRRSLLEWFLACDGPVNGYCNAIYSGLPTRYVSDFVVQNIGQLARISGIYHLSGDKISKFDLLSKFAIAMGRDNMMVPDHSVCIDRSLTSSKLQNELDVTIPTWDDLIKILVRDFADVRR